MDDDDNPPEKTYPLSPAKMSKTPSWIMLGFVLGALFVLALPPRTPKPPPAPPPAAPAPAPREAREPPPLSRIEAVFEVWGQHAVWDGEKKTEVALWDPKEEAFSDFYEVRQIDGKLYFRSIPRLTRRVISRGKPMPDCPLRFTETEEQYQEWLEHGRRERPIQRMWEPPPRKANRATVAPPAIRPAESSIPIAPPPPVIEPTPQPGPTGGK